MVLRQGGILKWRHDGGVLNRQCCRLAKNRKHEAQERSEMLTRLRLVVLDAGCEGPGACRSAFSSFMSVLVSTVMFGRVGKVSSDQQSATWVLSIDVYYRKTQTTYAYCELDCRGV